MKSKKDKEVFSSGAAVFFATLGSAVGLGNIWKFPYIVGENGGAAFLIVYLACILLVGLPVMISEFFIGRKTRKNVLGAINALKPQRPLWKTIGVFGLLAAYMIMFFYSAVAGWVYSYILKSLRGDFNNIDIASASSQFDAAIVGPVSPVIWQIIAVAVVCIILLFGVKRGIERVTKTLMPVLFILIIICDIRSLFLPGATKGLSFLFKPDFSQLTLSVVLAAMGLAFFKLSLGMGTMITYSSYFTEDNNLLHTAGRVALADTIISLLAGIAIFPAVFSFNVKPDAGPGLLFKIIPLVFSKLPLGSLLLAIFFILAGIAATTAMLSMMEVIIAYFTEEKGISRRKAVLINGLLIILLGIFPALSVHPKSIFASITIVGGRGIFDSLDWISSTLLLPLGGLIISILVGHFMDKNIVRKQLTNEGTVNKKLFGAYYFIVKYITPILLVIVFLSGIIK